MPAFRTVVRAWMEGGVWTPVHSLVINAQDSGSSYVDRQCTPRLATEGIYVRTMEPMLNRGSSFLHRQLRSRDALRASRSGLHFTAATVQVAVTGPILRRFLVVHQQSQQNDANSAQLIIWDEAHWMWVRTGP